MAKYDRTTPAQLPAGTDPRPAGTDHITPNDYMLEQLRGMENSNISQDSNSIQSGGGKPNATPPSFNNPNPSQKISEKNFLEKEAPKEGGEVGLSAEQGERLYGLFMRHRMGARFRNLGGGFLRVSDGQGGIFRVPGEIGEGGELQIGGSQMGRLRRAGDEWELASGFEPGDFLETGVQAGLQALRVGSQAGDFLVPFGGE